MKNIITTRRIVQDDFKPIETWQLLEWCLKLGANEFTIDFIGVEGIRALKAERAESDLKKYELLPANREHLSTAGKDQFFRQTNLWRLCQDSIEILKELFPEGLFTHPSCEEDGWFENPIFYRNGELIMGIVSHEYEGFLILTLSEAEQLRQLGFKTHDSS